MTAVAPVSTPAASADAVGTIEARDFSFWYGKKQALRNISMAVRPRSVTALIGPSGCGKSTFLRSINRLNDLIPGIRHEGDLTLDGNSVYDLSLDVVARWQTNPKCSFSTNPRARSTRARLSASRSSSTSSNGS